MTRSNLFFRIILIAFILIYLIVFRSFPYFNLIFQTKVIIGLIFTLVVFIFPISGQFLITLAIFLLFPALVLLLTGRGYLADLLGEVIYFLIIFGFVKKLNDFRRLV